MLLRYAGYALRITERSIAEQEIEVGKTSKMDCSNPFHFWTNPFLEKVETPTSKFLGNQSYSLGKARI